MPSPSAWTTLEVASVAAATPHWSEPIAARIAFDETRTSRLGSPLGGRVHEVWVQRGQAVTAGTPLLSITSAGLGELEAERARAELEHGAAQATYDRVAALVAASSLPAKELVAAREQLTEAELAVHSIGARFTAIDVRATSATGFTVVAPRAGVIVDLAAAPGQLVSAADGSLITIADLADVWVIADVLDGAFARLAPTTRAQILLDDGTTLVAVVTQVSDLVDPDRHTLAVRLRAANPAGALRPGGHTRVRLFDDDTTTLVVPAEAVLTDGQQAYVYVRHDRQLTRRNVSAGPLQGHVRAIYSGLAAAETVVVRSAGVLDNQL